MRYATIQPLDIPAKRRVLVVSDIHSNLPFLQGLLEQAAFCEEDLLILLGDFTEKRTGGLETLRYIMALSQRENVFPVCGNCDDLILSFLSPELPPEVFHRYFSAWGEKCLVVEMAHAAGFTKLEDHAALRALLEARYQPELAFLRSLPTILLHDRFLFVHGGVPGEEGLEALEAWRCMKNDDFLSQGRRFRRWCVVGHWPVTLYLDQVQDAKPIIRPVEHIISIDGGCSLERNGQLNALVIPGDGSDHFSYVGYDGFPVATALDPQDPSPSSLNIRWGRSQVEILQRGPEFSRCRHLESGQVLDILTDYLYTVQGETRCDDTTDYHLPVQPGDRLSVIRQTSRGLLAKRDSVTGWYFGRISWEEGGAHRPSVLCQGPQNRRISR